MALRGTAQLTSIQAKAKMTGTSKRQSLTYSVVSLTVAASVCSLFFSILDGVNGKPGALISCFYYGLAIFICSLPGWVLALPIVLLVADTKMWRAWVLLAIGSGIGPLLMLSLGAYVSLTSTTLVVWAPEAKNLVLLSTTVSTVTTLLYLVLLGHGSKRAVSEIA